MECKGDYEMDVRLTLDHLVYGVPDLAEAMKEFGERLGRAPQAGGRHEGLGTHNAILPLTEEMYVELIARDPESPDPNQARPFGLDRLEGPRLITWAARSRSIVADVEAARNLGFDPGPIIPMSRRAPSGELLEWKLTLRAKPFGDGLLPFVIDWGGTPHPAAAQQNDDSTPTLALTKFRASHPDPRLVGDALSALGVDLKVELDPEPGLSALITGPDGEFLLQ
jgi:hypothetical protein